MTRVVPPLPGFVTVGATGWTDLPPVPLSDLAAAGYDMSKGTEGRADLGTDTAGVADARARLAAAGLLPAGDPRRPATIVPGSGDPYAVRLAFLVKKWAGAPGALVLALTAADLRVLHLDLFPALTADGRLVVANVLMDRASRSALVGVGTAEVTAARVVDHVERRGYPPADPLQWGSVMVGTTRAGRFGLRTATRDAHLWKPTGTFEVFRRTGRLPEGRPGEYAPHDFAGWLTRVITATVSP